LYHALSQIWSLLLSPSNALIALLAAGLLLISVNRKSAGRAMVIFAGVSLCVVAVLPVGSWLLATLETRFPANQAIAFPITGVIILGGAVSDRVSADGYHPQPNEAADRLFVTAELEHRFPSAEVVVSGGPIDRRTGRSEADAVAHYLETLGVPAGRIVLERRSKDTFENAQFSADLVHPRPGQRWLLVTSAFHMPRAIASFRRAGFWAQAAPADWRTSADWWRVSWSAATNLKMFDTAAREYLALVTYWLRGRTVELFPRP
jgi:uncharacterized SAM-binding protein YcdF (DUF218 family)